MSRRGPDGAEIGADYQRRCIDSWEQAGFKAVSVNSSREPHTDKVRVVQVPRDAEAVTGRPHVFFADLLAVAQETRGVFAITNADIVLPRGTSLLETVAGLRPGEFVFSRRLDVDVLDGAGVPFETGYDFFAGHTDDLRGIPDVGLAFGGPWWDHFLPLVMHMRGVRIRQTEPVVLHLLHDQRWSMSLWKELGRRFITEFRPLVTDDRYREALDDAVRQGTGKFAKNVVLGVLKRVPGHAHDEPYSVISRLVPVNTGFLDAVSLSAGPASSG